MVDFWYCELMCDGFEGFGGGWGGLLDKTLCVCFV